MIYFVLKSNQLAKIKKKKDRYKKSNKCLVLLCYLNKFGTVKNLLLGITVFSTFFIFINHL